MIERWERGAGEGGSVGKALALQQEDLNLPPGTHMKKKHVAHVVTQSWGAGDGRPLKLEQLVYPTWCGPGQ